MAVRHVTRKDQESKDRAEGKKMGSDVCNGGAFNRFCGNSAMRISQNLYG